VKYPESSFQIHQSHGNYLFALAVHNLNFEYYPTEFSSQMRKYLIS